MENNAPDYKDVNWTDLIADRVVKWDSMMKNIEKSGWQYIPLRAEYDFTSGLVILPVHEGKRRGTLIVCAGGGYMFKSANEAFPVAEYFYNAGLNAAILDYHVDASKPMGTSMEIQLSAAEDGLAAIRYLRSHADEYGIPTDKIAIGGFSAGGILSARAAVKFDYGNPAARDPMLRVSSRPDAALILYGAMSQSDIHNGGLFDFDFSEQAKRALNDPIRNIHPDCPPMFVFQTHADDPRHALNFCYELACNGVPYELHTFEEGPHGGALYDGKHEDSPYFPHTARWASLALEWLEDKGF